ncbi:MAG: PepSY domain-containing protein [Ardenticatenaceae bacterium]|nr:PepSY domain-containing protein [Anaerolineales bacterium]MCB8938550.1 PepSY domain-containing protein [Ardenticatenaceae bacterium]MCB8973683.1 PepSY domain-containing protein [Ardenticatenaceae bacterium]
MKINKRTATVVMLAGLLLGSLGVGLTLTGKPQAASAQQTVPAAEDGDNVQEPSYTGSIPVDEAQTDGMNEADEAAALQGKATISADEAKAAAEAANPGAQAVKVELDNQNGYLVYSVELDNGLDVKIDAGDAAVLHTEQADNDADEEDNEADEAGDTDDIQEENEADDDGDTGDVQEEHEAEGEADDAAEGSEAPEDAPEAVPAP